MKTKTYESLQPEYSNGLLLPVGGAQRLEIRASDNFMTLYHRAYPQLVAGGEALFGAWLLDTLGRMPQPGETLFVPSSKNIVKHLTGVSRENLELAQRLLADGHSLGHRSEVRKHVFRENQIMQGNGGNLLPPQVSSEVTPKPIAIRDVVVQRFLECPTNQLPYLSAAPVLIDQIARQLGTAGAYDTLAQYPNINAFVDNTAGESKRAVLAVRGRLKALEAQASNDAERRLLQETYVKLQGLNIDAFANSLAQRLAYVVYRDWVLRPVQDSLNVMIDVGMQPLSILAENRKAAWAFVQDLRVLPPEKQRLVLESLGIWDENLARQLAIDEPLKSSLALSEVARRALSQVYALRQKITNAETSRVDVFTLAPELTEKVWKAEPKTKNLKRKPSHKPRHAAEEAMQRHLGESLLDLGAEVGTSVLKALFVVCCPILDILLIIGDGLDGLLHQTARNHERQTLAKIGVGSSETAQQQKNQDTKNFVAKTAIELAAKGAGSLVHKLVPSHPGVAKALEKTTEKLVQSAGERVFDVWQHKQASQSKSSAAKTYPELTRAISEFLLDRYGSQLQGVWTKKNGPGFTARADYEQAVRNYVRARQEVIFVTLSRQTVAADFGEFLDGQSKKTSEKQKKRPKS